MFYSNKNAVGRAGIEGWHGIDQLGEDGANPNYNAMVQRFTKRFGREARNVVVALAYDTARVAIHGIANADIPEPRWVRDGIERIRWMPATNGGPSTLHPVRPGRPQGLQGRLPDHPRVARRRAAFRRLLPAGVAVERHALSADPEVRLAAPAGRTAFRRRPGGNREGRQTPTWAETRPRAPSLRARSSGAQPDDRAQEPPPFVQCDHGGGVRHDECRVRWAPHDGPAVERAPTAARLPPEGRLVALGADSKRPQGAGAAVRAPRQDQPALPAPLPERLRTTRTAGGEGCPSAGGRASTGARRSRPAAPEQHDVREEGARSPVGAQRHLGAVHLRRRAVTAELADGPGHPLELLGRDPGVAVGHGAAVGGDGQRPPGPIAPDSTIGPPSPGRRTRRPRAGG